MPGRQRRGRGRGRGWGRPIRGFLEPCLLLVLQRGKSHGYDLKDELGPFGMGNVNPSLVYRALRDMEEEGLVRSEWDTESTAGPARRVYELTREGHERLNEWAEELRHTDLVLHHFLETVDRTTEEDSS
ncbi:MAG: helix-turn-helix transcriptional regulator [Anaerolineae bacterium]|jgi:PadR family transcriptional regulator PadR